jgi:hypothetical protein
MTSPVACRVTSQSCTGPAGSTAASGSPAIAARFTSSSGALGPLFVASHRPSGENSSGRCHQ